MASPLSATATIISSTVLQCLKAQGLTVVRLADTQYGSDELDAAFARDVAGNAAQALYVEDEAPVWLETLRSAGAL